MKVSEKPTERQIALAAIRFIRAKVDAHALKLERAKALENNPCLGVSSEYPACYNSNLLRANWCQQCQENQPKHEAYRTRVAERGAALRKLQSVVVRHIAEVD